MTAGHANRPTEAAAGREETLLRVRDLRVHFPRRSGLLPWSREVVRAVDGVSLDIRPGETLGLMGESGSGKSSTARAILRLERIAGGTVRFLGRDLTRMNEREVRDLRRSLQMIFQDPYGALNPRRTIGATVAEPLIVHGLASPREAEARARALLDMVGLPSDLAHQRPTELSGGQRQRVNIARALAPRPQLVVADEPTSALDVSIRAQLLNLLRRVQREQRVTYLLISHDLAVVRHMSTTVAVMYLGRIVEIADRDALYGNPQHPYTRGLLSAVPIADPAVEKRRTRTPISGEIPNAANPPSGCHFHPRCPLAFDRCRVEAPALRDLGGGHRAACFLAEPGGPAPAGDSSGMARASHLAPGTSPSPRPATREERGR